MRKEDIEHLKEQLEFFAVEIDKLKPEIEQEGTTTFTNNGKTLCANPKVKILNDYMKNYLAIIDKLMKLEGVADDSTSELEKHLRKKDK